MMQPLENQQPSLFEFIEEAPSIALTSAQKVELATLVEALLAEIAATLAKEVSNKQDHRCASGPLGLSLYPPVNGQPVLAQP